MADVQGLRRGFAEVDGDVVEIVLRIGEDEFAILGAKDPAQLAGNAGDERVGRDDGVLWNDCSRGNDRSGADTGVVEDDGVDADENLVFDGAAVDGGVVADGDEISDVDGIQMALPVENSAVLNVATGANADRVDVATEDRVHPDAGVVTEGDLADKLGGGIDIAASADGRGGALEGADHGGDCMLRSCASGATGVPIFSP
jgi:hypothetical protein